MAFLAGLLGPVLGGLFNKGGAGQTALSASAASLEASDESDQISSMMTHQAMSARATKFANVFTVADERTRETAEYDEYVLSVQGAEQNVLQKQMKMVDNATMT